MINMVYLALSMRTQTEKNVIVMHLTYSARDFEIPLCHIPPLRSFLFLDLVVECFGFNFHWLYQPFLFGCGCCKRKVELLNTSIHCFLTCCLLLLLLFTTFCPIYRVSRKTLYTFL